MPTFDTLSLLKIKSQSFKIIRLIASKVRLIIYKNPLINTQQGQKRWHFAGRNTLKVYEGKEKNDGEIKNRALGFNLFRNDR